MEYKNLLTKLYKEIKPVESTGERFEITIPAATVAGSDDFTGVLGDQQLVTSTQFKLEIKPPTGAVLEIERTTPANLDPVMNLN